MDTRYDRRAVSSIIKSLTDPHRKRALNKREWSLFVNKLNALLQSPDRTIYIKELLTAFSNSAKAGITNQLQIFQLIESSKDTALVLSACRRIVSDNKLYADSRLRSKAKFYAEKHPLLRRLIQRSSQLTLNLNPAPKKNVPRKFPKKP